MWLRSIYLKTLREYRIPIFGWGVGMALLVVATMASVKELIKTPEERQQLAHLAAGFTWNADPIALTTVGGYATWKVGLSILVVAVWPLLAASRTLRGEEQRGSMDVLLSLPRSRSRVAVEKIAAMWTALLAMGIVIGVLTYAGGQKFGANFTLWDGILFGENLALFCAVMGGIALLISQFTEERSVAAGWTAGLLLIFIALDMVHRVMPSYGWISRISPVYYYNLSKPLIPSYGTNAGAMLLLAALSLTLSGVAVRLFMTRDIGGTVPLPSFLRVSARPAQRTTALPTDDWSLRTVYTRSLRMAAWSTIWWTLGIAGFAAWIVVVVKQTERTLANLLAGSSTARTVIENLGGSGGTITAALLSAIFVFLPLFLMAFAVTQVNRWSADEQEGRLELVLAAPQPRTRVILARFAALATSTIFIGLMTLAASAAAVAATGLSLDPGNLAAATLGMIPMALLIASIGYMASGWLRTAADTGLLSFLLLAWFFISFIGPDLNWPAVTLRLSAFYYYGSPLLQGLRTASMLGVVAVGALALALGVARFARKDIGT